MHLGKRRVDGLARDQQFFNGIHADGEVGFGFIIKCDLDNFLNAASTDHHGYANIKIVDAILASQVGRCGQNALLIVKLGFGHCDAARGWRVISRTSLEQSDDFATTAAGALNDRVNAILRRHAHRDKVRHWNA